MSPTPFQSNNHTHDNRLVKRENMSMITTVNDNNNNNNSLKVHRDSHAIKKSSTSSSTTATMRGPVIIYTHSPKVIHTHPKDFMALVQKLTGMNRSDGVDPTTDYDSNPRCKKPELNNNYGDLHRDLKKMIEITSSPHDSNNNNNNNSNSNSYSNDDNESSSVITDENCSSSNRRDRGFVGQLNSCVAPPLLHTQTVTATSDPLFPSLPFYNMAGSSKFLYCGVDQSLYDYMDVNFSYKHTN